LVIAAQPLAGIVEDAVLGVEGDYLEAESLDVGVGLGPPR
jgi:hypothetical protein